MSSGEIAETQSVKWQIPYAYHRFWPRMRAFAVPTFYDGRVRINLEGRERDGVVPLEEYEQACREVVNAARACRNPRTGRELVADVTLLRTEDPMDPDGPEADVQLVWDGIADSLEHPDVGTIGPFPYRRTGGALFSDDTRYMVSALRELGHTPERFEPREWRNMARLARLGYAARIAGSAWAEISHAR